MHSVGAPWGNCDQKELQVAKSAQRKTARKSAGAKKTGGARKAATSRKTSGASRSGGARKSGGRRSGGTANAAFMAPVTPSDKLAEVVGSKPIPRTEVTKRLWAYIKKNGLQDEKNRRMIKSDAALKPVFGGKPQVNMFEMTKLVNKHLS
jgi:upstream activation factor subunit UAF30